MPRLFYRFVVEALRVASWLSRTAAPLRLRLPRLAGFAEVDCAKNAHHDEAETSCNERGISRGRNAVADKKKASNQKIGKTPDDINKR